jgi:hypothetical protein
VKLAMILGAGGEPEIVEANLAFHLNAGVDVVVAPEALAPYEEYVHVPPQDADPTGVAAELAADWVFSAAANEFWWPRGGSLKEVLASVPERYGEVRALVREFVPTPDDGSFFAERLVERTQGARASGLRSVYRTGQATDEPVPLRGWYPLEVLSLPAAGSAPPAGETVSDTRLRDALRTLRRSDGSGFALPRDGEARLSFPRPSVVDEAAYAVEVAALGESDLARLRQRLEELEGRLAALEQVAPSARLRKQMRRLVGRR